MRTRLLVAGLALLVGLAGCLGAPGADPTVTGTPGSGDSTPTPDEVPTSTTAESTVPTTADTGTPTRSGTPTAVPADENVTVEYVVRAGEIPDDVASVTVTMAVVFADDRIYHCDGDMRSGAGFGTPTPTPDPDHDVDCLRFGNLTLELTDLNGSRSLGSYSVPASHVAEYALVVRDVSITREDGTTVDDVYAELFRAHTSRGATNGRYGVAIDVLRRPDDATPRPDRRRHADSPYEVGSTEFTPEPGQPPVRYGLAVGGTVEEDGQVTVRVTRDGAPADLALAVEGGAADRYRTGPDGTVAIDVANPAFFDAEVLTDDG